MTMTSLTKEISVYEYQLNFVLTEETQKGGDVNSVGRAISEIPPKDVKFVDVKESDLKITIAIEKLANVNARRTMTDINATSVRFVASYIEFH